MGTRKVVIYGVFQGMFEAMRTTRKDDVEDGRRMFEYPRVRAREPEVKARGLHGMGEAYR